MNFINQPRLKCRFKELIPECIIMTPLAHVNQSEFRKQKKPKNQKAGTKSIALPFDQYIDKLIFVFWLLQQDQGGRGRTTSL